MIVLVDKPSSDNYSCIMVTREQLRKREFTVTEVDTGRSQDVKGWSQFFDDFRCTGFGDLDADEAMEVGQEDEEVAEDV